MNTNISRCTLRGSLHFRWFGPLSDRVAGSVDEAAEVFRLALIGFSDSKNEYLLDIAESEFRQRIERASHGKLRSSRHIKGVAGLKHLPLFEIRWQGIFLRTGSATVGTHDIELHIRMYHSEHENAPGYFIGHHIHRKVISSPTETKRVQNDEIAIARSAFERGLSIFWGIRELQIAFLDITYNL